MGIANSDKCNACSKEEKDYIEHFFYQCDAVTPIWARVEQEITARTGSYLKITESIALLGYQENTFTNYKQNIINGLIILAKMCISKYRYGTNQPHIDLTFETELMLRRTQKPFQITDK